MFARTTVLLVVMCWFCCIARGQSPATIAETGEVFSYPNADPYDRHNDYGFNHAPSITRTADGKLIAAWFSGPFEASVHQLILGCISSNEGKTWSKGIVFNDTPRKSDFDPAFVSNGKRTWLFYSVGRWNRYPFVGGRGAEKTEVGIDSYKTFVKYTDDGGATWSEAKRIGDHTGSGPRSNGIQLSSGEMILPLHNYLGQQVSILKSSDSGETWKRILGPKSDEKASAAEPTIAETKSGQLMMVIRTKDGWLWTSRSTDKGESWSDFLKTDMPAAASSASLISLKDGRLALIHNPTKPPLRTSLTIRFSTDEGQTWGEPLELAKVEAPPENDEVYSRQVAYPSAIQLPSGDVFVVWTQISISPSVQSGKICWARVRLN